ncbi:MAG: radical SAM family heme chaperone HemW [Bacteroidota bacterium]|nr:radical SAM family heme chaperone HemW [Bacteroidota bacterium]
MAGIYIHIPFCKQACYYCNFYFSTSLVLKEQVINSLIREIEIRSKIAKDNGINEIAILSSPDEMIETIYFGGGTPSLLLRRDIERILSSINNNYKVDHKTEITLEANPDDITFEKLNDWKNEGIIRLSIGIQSFIERDLLWMNRAHNAQQAVDCIHLVRQAGFNNFSIDLIFGIPNLSNEEWKENVQKVIDMNVPHIACYALTVEPKTALQKMIALNKRKDIDTDVQATQYSILMKMMHGAGYEHYEISNFAEPGFRSRHNSSYWQGKKYIGIGPSAHSYNGKMRMWNKANNAEYIHSIEQNTIPFEKEILTESQKLNEYIMTSLRTIEGLDLNFIEENFSTNDRKRIESVLSKNVEKKNYFITDEKIILTDEGKLFADGIAVRLFL